MRVEIEKIAFGGYGIGRVDGKIVFVDRVIPGELAEIE
ncbi:MAG: TRAM domain-containing protein, partial [Thermodesulfobacteriota bacterium]